MRIASRVAASSLLLVTAPCLSVSEGARSEFAKQHTCPPEQVTVKPRPDVAPHQLIGASLTSSPPPDVIGLPGS